MARPKYYITTPIYYATDAPHIGHAYCTIAADTAARYRRLTGHDVFLLSGTDEHGQKMERAAAELGIAPLELANRTAGRYAELWSRLDVRLDGFLRTTEPRHAAGVSEVWRRMLERGDVYRSAYEGRYCVACESFYLDKELVDGKCPDHGTVPELLKEEGYFFRLSAYAERLLEHYERHPDFVAPESRRNEVLSFVRSGLRDISVSRATTHWGIPVPNDPEHVIYVWVDALTNYLTGLGYPQGGEALQRFWPADVHVVGKDILRFHAVYWPAFLMSAGLPLPRQIFGHGWWLRDNVKISKSKAGAIKVEPFIEALSADALRYFLLREIPFGLDGSFSDEALLARYNADLANDYGNLVSRTLQVVSRFANGVVPEPKAELKASLRELAERTLSSYRAHFDSLAFSRGLESVFELVRAGNRHIDESAPWTLAKSPERRAELDQALYEGAEIVRLVSVCLHPVMPARTRLVFRSLGFAEGYEPGLDDLRFGALRPQTRLGEFAPLFPRVEAKTWLEQASSKAPVPARAEPGAIAPFPAAPAATTTTTATATAAAGLVSIDEFFRTELKVARVTSAERIKGSKKLLKLSVDLGSESRQIVAGIAERYAPEALVGRSVIVVANLKPAKLMGVESHGMLLAASIGGLPVLASFEEDIPPGTQVR